MKYFKYLFIIFFIMSSISIKAESNDLSYQITKNLRCLICQGQSVYDSDSEFAISLKLVVNEKLNEGLSETEIYDFLKDKYGQWILYDPGLNKNTYLLWLLPLLLFVIGGAIIFKKFIIKKN
ncbi:MAG: cytochrome c heme lyase subunit CcmL [Pelagibacteraceae bacterium BACL5 MAG-121015-bin10]|jgi:cytochrome c-type biogenesis protein CcmH|nr:MAG: cytochrome c heme lyase subunit CcmL [Pelagibacteraceae bacterium BACL5 MAG-121015-bin10]